MATRGPCVAACVFGEDLRAGKLRRGDSRPQILPQKPAANHAIIFHSFRRGDKYQIIKKYYILIDAFNSEAWKLK